MTPQKSEFGSRSRWASFLTTGILFIFRGLKNEPNKETEPKRAFCRAIYLLSGYQTFSTLYLPPCTPMMETALTGTRLGRV